MIVTIAGVTDPDRFLRVFGGAGVAKRREHGCRSARAYVDPDDPYRVWSVFDWDEDDYRGFLADPTVADIARELGLRSPPVRVTAAAEHDA